MASTELGELSGLLRSNIGGVCRAGLGGVISWVGYLGFRFLLVGCRFNWMCGV